MFVGHGLVAFSLVAVVVHWRGHGAERALTLGVLAGAFATVPDVDILYALTGLVGVTGLFDAATAFWTTGNEVHRAVTHSLPVSAVAALAAGAWRRGGRWRPVAVASLATLTVVAALVTGPVAATVMAAFALAIVGLAHLARRVDVSVRETAAVAFVGLASHPFGDLFTGQPPALAYPLDVTVLSGRLAFASDPTLHLLGAFWFELATVWLALAVLFRLTDRSLAGHVSPRATVGGTYALAALVLPAPTLDTSYHFVFSVLAVGTVGAAPTRRRSVPPWATVTATGLTAVTLASVGYAFAYLFV